MKPNTIHPTTVWIKILRRWYQYHKDFDHRIHFTEDEIRYRPCIDSLALDYFCEDLGLLRDQSIAFRNTVNSEKAPQETTSCILLGLPVAIDFRDS